jgi:hypothetical protein
MPCVLGDAFHTNVIIVSLAKKLVGLIMQRAKLVVFPDLLFMASQL